MSDPPYHGLRIWGEAATAAPAGAATEPDVSLEALAVELGRHETLRLTDSRPEPAELLTAHWFRDLQSVRHQRQGRWMPALLEFGRHAGERLLGLGCGLGSDLVCYAAAGAEVIAACAVAEQLALVRRNFESRNLTAAYLRAGPSSLPLESASMDVVCLQGVLHESAEPARVVTEIYRVLKPGGKLLAVLPARYDIDFWRPYLAFGEPREPDEPNPLLHSQRRFKASEVRELFAKFVETRLYRRHLRRGEVPHVCRWMPLPLLERVAGRLLVVKALKPVSSAISEQQAA